MEMFGAYCQILISYLSCLTLIATLCCATVNTSVQYVHSKDNFKLFLVISETYSDVNQECSASECNTLAYFMNHSMDYFKSNEIYQFQAGTHTPLDNSTVSISGVSNLILCGPNLSNESALINCSGASVAFMFENSSNIIIKDLDFDYCAPALDFHSDSVYYHGYAVLDFINNTNIYLSSLSLSHSVDEAFYIQDTIGKLRLSDLQVTHSNTAGKEIASAGNAIVYRTCSEHAPQLILEDSVFSNNSNLAQTNLSKCPTPVFSKGGVPQGGGLSIRVECNNVNISIHNLIMIGNAGGDGGNLELVFDGSTLFAPVEIINSHFESGYGLEGGGMRIIVLPSAVFTTNVATNVSLNVRSSTQNMVFLHVRNTIFIENEAVYAGAGVYIKQEQALGIRTQLGIVFLNSTFINNAVCKTGFGGIAFHSINYHATGYYHHKSPQFQIILKNCEFYGNFAHDNNQRSGSGTGTIFAKSNQYFELNSCIVHDNNSTGLLAISSNIIASGDIGITDNRKGSSGGGILLCQNAVVYFNARVTLTITNNRAEHAGGGICVETECLQSKPPCFFQLGYEPLVNRSLIDTIHVNVSDNSASFAGHNLFGGSIDYCYMIDDPKHKAKRSMEIFKKLFKVPNNTVNPQSITSSPLTVCLCNKDEMLCGQKLPHNLTHRHVFRGERFKMNVVLVGQQNGLVPGTVNAWLKGIQLDKINSFGEGQKVQKIGTRKHCSTLEYAIRAASTYREVILQLGVEPSGDVSGFELLQQYKRLEINVMFKKCPIGFAHVNGSCICNRLLSLRNIKCNIRHQTISGVSPGWIGLVNSTLVYQRHCPYDYCSSSNIKIHSNETALHEDEQCATHRTGIMCGKCADGLSMVFGTHRCKYCSNYWLLMLPVYAMIGVVIVLMLTMLDITISEGTFGGLIFYCNIVRSNYSTYFQGANIPLLTSTLRLFISLFSLETGQTGCLFNGMDAYIRNWLNFGFPLYLWFLTGVMICLSKRYSWIVRRNAVKVLATIILLSYAQNLLTAIDALHVAILYREDGKHEWRWLGDGSLKYFEGKHIPLALFSSLFSLILLPFAFALFFNQCLQRVSHHRPFSWVTRLKPLFDAYTGPFNANARFWTGLLLIVRILILITSAYNSGGDPGKTLDAILVTVVLLLATSHSLSAGLYRRHCLNILESWFLVNLVLLSASAKSHYSVTFSTISSHLLIGLAFLTALGIIAYHISKIKATRKLVSLLFKYCCRCKRKREFHRMQQSLDWNSDDDRFNVENFPRYVPVNEEREPLLASI